MTSITSQCSNCQILEKTILDANSSVKKLLTLKSKIIHTDALIRQFKAQKDENEKLLKDNKFLQDDQEKSQNQCAKYEIDLKLALEELHSLRQCERDYKTSSSKFQSEIFSLSESLQAEQALVKQYKSLVEAEEHAKNKDVESLEKKLSKKDSELQKSKEKVQRVNKNFNVLSKSCVKALKLLQKLESHPGLVDNLPASEKRTFKGVYGLLHKTKSLFGAPDLNSSSDDEDEFLDESQRLENLLMETVPDDGCLETEDFAVGHETPINDTGTHLVNGYAAQERTPVSMPVVPDEKTSQIRDPTSSSGLETQSNHLTDTHNNTNCVQKHAFKATPEYVNNHVTSLPNEDVEETLTGDAEFSISSLEGNHVDNNVSMVRNDSEDYVYQESVALMETDELLESDLNDNNLFNDAQPPEENVDQMELSFANVPILNESGENVDKIELSSAPIVSLTVKPKLNDLNVFVENVITNLNIDSTNSESNCNGNNLFSDVNPSEHKLDSIACLSKEPESNDLNGFAENIVTNLNAESLDATDSQMELSSSTIVCLSEESRLNGFAENVVTNSNTEPLDATNYFPCDKIVSEPHSGRLAEEVNSSSSDNNNNATADPEGCHDQNNFLDSTAHSVDAQTETCNEEVTQEMNVSETSLACDYAPNENSTSGDALPDPKGSEGEVAADVCNIESECEENQLVIEPECETSNAEVFTAVDSQSEEMSLTSDIHKADEKASVDECNIENKCKEDNLVIASECGTSIVEQPSTVQYFNNEVPLASDNRKTDEKASVDDCNIESECEEGELVIASECETGTVDKSATEENCSEAMLLASDYTITDGDCNLSAEVSHDEQYKVKDHVENNSSSEPVKCLERKDESLENCSPFTGQVGIDNNSEKVSHVRKDKAEDSRVVFRGSSDSSLPPIPFSDDRQFQPSTSSKPCVADLSSNSSKENPDGHSKNSNHREPRKSQNKVDKICSRMKHALELRCPVSPLPPSPPMTPLLKEPMDSLFADPAGSNDPTISDLFGGDSDDENDPFQNAKSILQHQESEGFDPDTEHQEDVPRKNGLDQREVLRSIGQKTKETGKHDDDSVSSDKRQKGESSPQMKRPRSAVDHSETQIKPPTPKRNSQGQGNSSLLTDFHMDPDSGHCKISIRLPENLSSATNVRLELDTSSKEIHIDYGPSNYGGRLQTPISNGTKQDYCTDEYSKSQSPMVTFPEDTPRQSQPIRRPPNFHASKAQEISTELVPGTSMRRPLRRTTVPPLGQALNTRSLPRKALAIETCDKSPVSSNAEELSNSLDASQVSSTAVFKMPALKRRTSLAAQRKKNVDAKPESLSPSDSPSSRSTVAITDEILLSPLSPPISNPDDCINNSHDENKPSGICGKRKLDQSPPKNSSKRVAHIVAVSPSDSTVQKYAKITAANVKGCQIEVDPKILKAFKPLQKLKINNSKNSALFAKLYKNVCSPSLALSCEDLVGASLVYFSRSTLEILPSFPKKKVPQLPLLGIKEEAFVSLLKHLQEKQEKMNSLIGVFLGGAGDQLSRTDKVCPTGLAALCRLHTVLCRQEGYTQAAQDLCYQFVLRKHPHAAYLIANALVVWPSVLELTCTTALLKLRKKVLSLLLFSTITEENDQTARILRDVGNLESPGPDNQPDALAKEILSLLTSKVDVSTSEDICQQLLLLSYTQGWPWTKDTVLPPLVDVLNSVPTSVKTPVVRLIGSFLHYCGPKAKEDSDLLVLKLQTLFKELDENDFLPKESCIHNLLPLSSQLDDCSVSQMKQWLQQHRSRLSPHLQQDFINSGFLD